MTVVERFRSRAIFDAVLRLIEQGGTPSYNAVEPLLAQPDKVLLAAMVFADDTLHGAFSTEQAVACVRRLAQDEREAQRQTLRERIKDAERAGDFDTALRLMQELTGSEGQG